ncbi:MAG: DNA circularization N-terminal domain-containing protein [Planctomycetota bacterium]
MGWQDRLKEPSLTAPSGASIVFLYENVKKSFDRKTRAFEFPDADGTFVQDLGRTGRRLPLRMILSGDDYDIRAKQLDDMLGETGIFVLVHPIYGTFNVVPFGTVSRRDDLKTRGNQAVFDVTFFETNDLLFPTNAQSPGDDVIAAITAFNDVGPAEFEAVLDVDTVIEEASLKDRYESIVAIAKSGLQTIAKSNEKIERTFDTVFDSISLGVDTFIGDPLALAFQTQILMQLPARAGAAIGDRLSAYGDLLTLLTTDGTVYTPSNDSQPDNDFRNDYLFASNLLIGAITSVVDNEFELKPDAITAADVILAMCDELNAWKDDNLVSLGAVDTGETYQQVIDACSLTAGFLVQISFSLKQERSLVLDRPRSPIDLESELYGTVDTNLDLLINSNELVGDEFFEIPVGRTVVYYV